jgi:hypothetical protein
MEGKTNQQRTVLKIFPCGQSDHPKETPQSSGLVVVICHNCRVPNEIVIALIGGGAGLITGALSSLIAPWSQWGVEKRRLTHQLRVEQVRTWRAGVEELRQIEDEVCPSHPVPGPPGSGGYTVRSSSDVPDPSRANAGRMAWYVSLRDQLDEEAREKAEALRKQRIFDRSENLPDFLAIEIGRIERRWKLI